jgi:DNA polymerase III subunit delta
VPALSAEALTRALQQGARGGVFFLHGDEEHLKELLAAEIIAVHVDAATRDFNLDQLRGTDVEPETLASILHTPPLMAAWRVVHVRDAQGLAGAQSSREVIEQVLQRPVPGLALVLSAQIPQGSKAKFYDRLIRAAQSVELAALPAADLPGWLMARAQESAVELEPAAARALAVAAGPGLALLVTELAKLVSYVGERRRITVADVGAVVERVPRQNRWEWFDMVGDRRFAEARAALPVLLEAGESGVGLVIGLGTHFLRLALARDGEKAVAAELPPHQRWLARRLTAQARKWSAAALDDALDDLFRADRLLKSVPLSDEQIIEELVLRLNAAGRATAGALR